MRFRLRKNQSGTLYPVSILFFSAAITLLFYSSVLYIVHYRIYDGLENTYRSATILLMEEFEQQSDLTDYSGSGWSNEENLFSGLYGLR